MTLEKKYYSIAEASSISGLSKKSLREGCKTGRFPHVWVGRVIKLDLEGTFAVLEQEQDAE